MDDAVELGRAVTSMHILVVDDQHFERTVVSDLLHRHGYTHVTTCAEGERAVAICQSGGVDLVLLDLHMPKYDGFDVLRDLAQLIRGSEMLPVCLLTADHGLDRRREALALGGRDFLTKPVDPLELALRVHNMLEVRMLQARLQSANSNLSGHVRRRTAELEASRLEMLHRLARASEWRDDETQRHAERIGHMVAMVARCLGLGAERVEQLELAAPLHDVGKVGISDSILLKAGPLTDEERAEMQRHAEIGGRILGGSHSHVLRTAEAIAWSHHERWDGGGYPFGLAGTAIPLEGRIVAVADVFDALTHARPYKKAWPIERALEVITQESGHHFDPEVVEAFLAVSPMLTDLATV